MDTAIVTGGAGFIGSYLVARLAKDGWRVVVLDSLTDQHRSDWRDQTLPDYRDNVELRQVDIASGDFDFEEADSVFHLAAESNVDRSIDNPSPFWVTNVMGTVRVTEKAIASKTPMVHVSTDEVYGPKVFVGSDESDQMMPTSPYAQSKAAAEFVVRSAHRTYGLDARIVRPGNAYGIGQFNDKLIPRIIAATQAQPLPLYGEGFQRREWTRVEDIVDGIMLVASKGQSGSTYNASSGESMSNASLIELFESLLGRSVPLRVVEDPRGKDHDSMYCINSRELRQIGWKPKGIEEGISLLVSNLQSSP